jgi:ferric-dicitrate binding protein FerR (iron transport regulator)
VRVGPLGRAALALADDSVLRLDQRTTLRLQSVSEAEPSLLELLLGAVHFFARRPRTLEVETPYVNAAVRGTEFLVRDLQAPRARPARTHCRRSIALA